MEKNGAFLKKLLETFKVEAAEHIAAISSGLIELEKTPAPGRQAEIIESVFRESHSMKGAARAVNLLVIEGVCQSFESVLSALKRKEISPYRELLDLLHGSVNMLDKLLYSVGEGGSPSDKAAVKDIIHELNSAAKGAESRKRDTGGIHDEVSFRPSEEPPPPFESAHPANRAAAETMRISKRRLDSILLQAEELLSVKQLMSQRISDLHETIAETAALKKEWEKIRPVMRRVGKVSRKDGSGASTMKLLDFLDAKGEQFSKLHSALESIGQAQEHDNRSITAMADGLLENLKTVSMLPFSSLLEMMPKVVRDLSHDQGKDAEVIIHGGETKIDRRILDEMLDPVIHLVRNCVDHGIEKPGQRAAMNKPPTGTVSIHVAHREGKSAEIVISDDGAGVDISRIKNSAVRLGILSGEEAGGMDEAGLLPLIFRSGVTTSPIITDISGRGLGLAIVQEKVERLGGSMSCESSEGKGTTFRILLPLTLATFRGVLVQIDDRRFIIPITGLDRMVRAGRDEIRTVENRETIIVKDRTVPLVPLRAVLEMPRREKADSKYVQAAVLGSGGDRIAFGVDNILNEQEVLVKDLGKQLARVRNIAGATVLGTGEVVPVLNVSDLMKSAVRISPGAESPSLPEEKPAERKSVLVVEDSITARTLLKNILEAAGYDVQTAVDGIDAITFLKTGRFDIVVSDIDMPRMSGLDLTAKIRADKGLSALPVVLVTALESREDRERGIDVGANAYIVKSSFDQSNLLEAIKRLI